MRLRPSLLLSLILAAPVCAQQTASQWIWYPEQPAADCVKEDRWFRRAFDLTAAPTQATLWLMVDDNQKLWVITFSNQNTPLSNQMNRQILKHSICMNSPKK